MECAAIALVVIGVVLATVTDSTVMTNMLGCLLSGAAIVFSAVYQVKTFAPYILLSKTAAVASLRLPRQCSLIILCIASFQSCRASPSATSATKELVAFPFSTSLRRSIPEAVLVQVWIGTKQKELEAGSMQLMHQYTPWATGLLAVLVPIFEPVGFTDPAPGTILGFNYTFLSSVVIMGSAVSALTASVLLLCKRLHVPGGLVAPVVTIS